MLVKIRREDDGSYAVRDVETNELCIGRLSEEDALGLFRSINRANARERLRLAFQREAERREPTAAEVWLTGGGR